MPAKITEPAVGASQWASGSQIWTGTSGILTANEAKKANQQKRAQKGLKSTVFKVKKSVVPKQTYT